MDAFDRFFRNGVCLANRPIAGPTRWLNKGITFMRILVIHREMPFPADNGGRLRAAHVTRYLSRHHDVALACFSGRERPEPFPERDNFRDLRLVPWPRRSTWARRAVTGLPSEVLDLRSPAMARALAELHRVHAPQVTIVSDPALAQYLDSLPNQVRVLDYLMVSTLALERFGRLVPIPQRWIWKLRWFKAARHHRAIAHLFDLCLVNSREDLEDLLATSDSWRRVEFVPNGLPLEEYPLGLAPVKPCTLVYPGSVTYGPNRDAVAYFITQILPRVRAAVPDVRLLVTGALPNDGSAPQDPGVVYTGRMPDVRPVIAGASACVVPLRSGAGGTRFKVLEAMALGTPVVSTTIGAEGVERIDDADLLVADDPEQFAAQTVKLLTQPELRARFSAAGRRLIEQRYNWDILGDRISNMLEELVAAKEQSPGIPAAAS